MIKSVNNQNFKIIAVSNRKLCNRPFLEQIERVCKIHPEAVILREKDLTDREAAVTRKELMAEAKNTLASDNLPVELAEVLDYTDADSCMKSMEKVKNAFQKAVEAAVEEKLKGGKPQKKAPETDTQKALEQQVYNAMMGKY